MTRLGKAQQTLTSIFGLFRLVAISSPAILTGYLSTTILQGSLPLASAWVTKLLFDLLAEALADGGPVQWARLILLLAIQAALAIANHLTTPAGEFLNAELGRRLLLIVKAKVYAKVNSFSGIAYFENPRFYDTIRLAEQGTQRTLKDTVLNVARLIQSTVTLMCFLGALLAFSPILVALVTVASLPQLFAQLRFSQQRFTLAKGVSQDQRQQAFFSFMLSSPPAAKEVRLFNLGGYFVDKLIHLYRRVHRQERSQQLHEMRWRLGLGVISSVVASGAFVIVAIEAFAGRLSLGDVTLYVSALASVQGALSAIIVSLAGLNETLLFHSAFTELLALPQPIPISATPKPVPRLCQSIELRDVSFRYSPEHPWVLRGVNLKIAAGRSLALVGLNGVGKTTLVKLLTRLYDPTEGQILWDGIDLREYDPVQLREHIGAIFQDFMRYDLTVQENIGLGDCRNVTDLERVRRAAAKVSINERIERLPQGYQTKVSLMFGGDGPSVDLSGGEWQKIAIARMFMRESDLLILDEPTAALDPQAEYEIHSHFVDLVAGRTSVLISHRFGTVRMADTIALLEDGSITEVGTHDELLRQNATYARLYRMQLEKYGL